MHLRLRHLFFGLLLLAGLLAAVPLAATVAGQASTPVATPASATPAAGGVVREVLASSDPAEAPGEVLSLVRYTIPAGAKLPVHKHPGDQMATVISGTLTYHVVANGDVPITRANGTKETAHPGDTITFTVGDSWVEPEGMIHYAENLTDQPVVLLSSSLFAANEPPTELVATPAA
jgi:quercetin dioxygenase-like cupin family protein